MLKGFRDFVMRGNVVDLAVAVVIGAAFGQVVTAFTNSIVKPLIAAAGGANVNGLAVQLVGGNRQSIMDFGAVITALINFLIVAAVVYFLVVAPMNKLAELRKRGEHPEPQAPAEDILLLQEIRDLLRQRNSPV